MKFWRFFFRADAIIDHTTPDNYFQLGDGCQKNWKRGKKPGKGVKINDQHDHGRFQGDGGTLVVLPPYIYYYEERLLLRRCLHNYIGFANNFNFNDKRIFTCAAYFHICLNCTESYSEHAREG